MTSQQAEMRRLRGTPTKRWPAEWMTKGVGRQVQRPRARRDAGPRPQAYKDHAEKNEKRTKNDL